MSLRWAGSYLEQSARAHEPALALFAPTKHSCYTAIRDSLARCIPSLLRPGGVLVLEVPAGQAATVAALFTDGPPAPRWRLAECAADGRGTARCLVLSNALEPAALPGSPGGGGMVVVRHNKRKAGET